MLSNPRLFKFMLSAYPPWLGAGIYVKSLSSDYRRAEVGMKLRWYNRNYVRTQFGGSLYSMTDPMYMLLVMKNLGRDYIVWDKASSIEFISPGTSDVFAQFNLNDEQLETIRQHTIDGKPYLPEFTVDVTDRDDKLIARVHKTLYVRRKAEKKVS
ncbi:MAG: DUF4442 domain-containing protein [Endozoicomonas sp.]